MSNETSSSPRAPLDMDALRKLASEGKGKEIWRSFDDLADTDQFKEYLQGEYPRHSSVALNLNRRDFIKLLGASVAFAGLTACVPRINETILPYVNPPERFIPGKPLYYASAMPMGGYGRGVIVKTNMNRPIKVDGNPTHPDTLGASDLFMQASILGLYDPDRAKEVSSGGQNRGWEAFTAALSAAAKNLGANKGAGLRILSGAVTSPSLFNQIQNVLRQYPAAKWHVFEASGMGQNYAGAQMAFGQPVETTYNFDKANVILSLDNDFLFRDGGGVERYQHSFGARRQVQPGKTNMNRLYAAESSLTITGSNADHRLPMQARQVEAFARAIAAKLGVSTAQAGGSVPGASWVDPLAADLMKNRGASLVLAGSRQPPAVHALAHAMNQALGNVGQTVVYTAPVEAKPVNPFASLLNLAQDLQDGVVDLLVILETNAAYSAPGDIPFASLLSKAKFSVYLGQYADETAAGCQWTVPATHFLEMWGDARATDGTVSMIQPLIEPLYDSKSAYELLAALLGQPSASGYDIVRAYWQIQMSGGNFEVAWQKALSDGVVPGTALAPVNVTASAASIPAPAAAGQGLEIVFEPDPTIWDGAFTNNSWLQELPKPLTKLTWDNAALFSPNTAGRLGLIDQDVVELGYRGRTLQAPALIVPGQPDDTVTLTLGYGRRQGGQVQAGLGYNAAPLRTSDSPWFGDGLTVRKTGETYPLATTRDHWSMEGRDLVREATLTEFNQNPNFAQPADVKPPSLYPDVQYPGHAWGMAINLSTCIGCNACVLACQAENNIPVVGKSEVLNNREMQWLRIDRYYKGSIETPEVLFEPVPCMHCEQAPCEPVCPVEATSHSAEGINEMSYNRCVGTRYCSNNCPYKVRRFNFYGYADTKDEAIKAMRNPDVTVRSRGVMEKCSYCVQRINRARIQSEISGQPIKDGDLKTACQQACPTNAIVFGDLNDPASQVTQLKAQPTNYALLGELATRPRTTYLAKVRNPNPLIQE
ncbi:MAG TPA: TAT-variant-translocated molybdopterin oxidoreductase [Anaerolineaceae bacterium]|jgi:molybdopterin-containing oxidoreductase family iron-sulfur binding subunit